MTAMVALVRDAGLRGAFTPNSDRRWSRAPIHGIAARNRAAGGRTMRNWTDSSTLGVVGCFFVFLLLLFLAGWIALKIMEGMSPA
jgi:hypothetical protein